MSNLVWFNSKKEPKIKGPFTAYIVDYKTMRSYGDWLLGQKNVSSKSSSKWGFRYGEKNFLNGNLDIAQTLYNKIDKEKTSEDIYEKQLKQIIKQEEQIEKRFYSFFGCNNIDSFRLLWNNSSTEDLETYWISKVFSYFTGENVRLIGSRGRTDIEKIAALTAIRLEDYNIQGVETYKNEIKKELENQALLFLPRGAKNNNSKWDIWVNNKRNNEFLEDLSYWLTKDYQVNEVATETGKFVSSVEQAMHDTIQLLFSKSGNDVRKKITYRNNKNKNIKTIDGVFVNWDNKRLNKITIIQYINDFIDKIMAVKLNNIKGGVKIVPSWDAWVDAQQKFNLRNKITKILEEFFNGVNQKDISQYIYSSENISTIQGLFGEIHDYAVSRGLLKYAKVNKNQINIINLSNAKNIKGQSSKSDILVTISYSDEQGITKTEAFGIQSKNPFQTDHGYYDTYVQRWHFKNDSEMDNLYKNYLGFDQDQIDLFTMINANLKNTNPIIASQLIQDIKRLLLYYAPAFARLTTEQLQLEELPEDQQEILNVVGNNFKNIFFTLKGELIPVSEIYRGMLEQYKILKNYVDDKAIQTLKINYINKMTMNLYKQGDFAEEYVFENGLGGIGFRYDPSKIHQGDEFLKDLSKISFSTKLQLKIPSLESIINLHRSKG